MSNGPGKGDWVAASPPSESPPASGTDFAAFGAVEVRPLSRIQVIVSQRLTQSWTTIPHVTHHDEVDIEQLEAFRTQLSASGPKVTALAFLVKASVKALQEFPHFNASLDSSGRNLVFKQYFHIGIAVDTPKGLLVPVIRNADSKRVENIAAEIAAVSKTARTNGLPFDQMTGGSFTISALGAIGGTAFTPIIDSPEVAILGISRSYRKGFEAGTAVNWHSMLPISLSYDHRVINGADAGRFCVALATALDRPDKL